MGVENRKSMVGGMLAGIFFIVLGTQTNPIKMGRLEDKSHLGL